MHYIQYIQNTYISGSLPSFDIEYKDTSKCWFDIGYCIELLWYQRFCFQYRRMYASILKHPEMKNFWYRSCVLRYWSTIYRRIFDIKVFFLISDCFDIEDSSTLAFKTYTNIEVLWLNIEGDSTDWPCSCRAVDRNWWLQFGTSYWLLWGHLYSHGSPRPSTGQGVPPLLRVGCGSGCPAVQPRSPWFQTGYYAFIHLQIRTREEHSVSRGTDRHFMI